MMNFAKMVDSKRFYNEKENVNYYKKIHFVFKKMK